MVSPKPENVPQAPAVSWPDPGPICFGLDRPLDERSLAVFLARFADRRLLDILLPRLADAEIAATVAFLGGLLKQHLSHREYHQLFLGPEERKGAPEP